MWFTIGYTFVKANWKALSLAGLVLGAYLWHKWEVSSAYRNGREAERTAARVEAGKRIIEMERSNADFSSLSARDRCRAFMRTSGLPESECD